MSQIALYLDDATHALVNRAAHAERVSKSRWVADLIRRHADRQWPTVFVAAAGSLLDFPLRGDDTASGTVPDTPRLTF